MDAAARDRLLRIAGVETRAWFKRRPRDGDGDGFVDPDGKGPLPDRTPAPPPLPSAPPRGQKAATVVKPPSSPQYPTDLLDDALEPEVGDEDGPDAPDLPQPADPWSPEAQADVMLAEAPNPADPDKVQRWVVDNVPAQVSAYLADERLAALRGDAGLAKVVLGRVLVDADLQDVDLTGPGALAAAIWSALWAILRERESGEPFYRFRSPAERDRLLRMAGVEVEERAYYGHLPGERVPKGFEGGGRFKSPVQQLTALVKDWVAGGRQGPEPLASWKKSTLQAVAKELGLKPPKSMAVVPLKSLIYAHAEGKPTAPKKATTLPAAPSYLDPETFPAHIAVRLWAGEKASDIADDYAHQAGVYRALADDPDHEHERDNLLDLAAKADARASSLRAVAHLPVKPKSSPGPNPKILPAKAAPKKAMPKKAPATLAPAKKATLPLAGQVQAEQIHEDLMYGKVSKAQALAALRKLYGLPEPELAPGDPAQPIAEDKGLVVPFVQGMVIAGDATTIAWSGDGNALRAYLGKQNTSALVNAGVFFGFSPPNDVDSHDALVEALALHVMGTEGPEALLAKKAGKKAAKAPPAKGPAKKAPAKAAKVAKTAAQKALASMPIAYAGWSPDQHDEAAQAALAAALEATPGTSAYFALMGDYRAHLRWAKAKREA